MITRHNTLFCRNHLRFWSSIIAVVAAGHDPKSEEISMIGQQVRLENLVNLVYPSEPDPPNDSA